MQRESDQRDGKREREEEGKTEQKNSNHLIELNINIQYIDILHWKQTTVIHCVVLANLNKYLNLSIKLNAPFVLRISNII